MAKRLLQITSSSSGYTIADGRITVTLTESDLGRQLAREGLRVCAAEQPAPELSRARRRRMISGTIGASDVAALRDLAGVSQSHFARALGLSVDTLQNWEQGRARPTGTGLALLRVLALEPELLRRLISPTS